MTAQLGEANPLAARAAAEGTSVAELIRRIIEATRNWLRESRCPMFDGLQAPFVL